VVLTLLETFSAFIARFTPGGKTTIPSCRVVPAIGAFTTGCKTTFAPEQAWRRLATASTSAVERNERCITVTSIPQKPTARSAPSDTAGHEVPPLNANDRDDSSNAKY
jgi:hypothetical protein